MLRRLYAPKINNGSLAHRASHNVHVGIDVGWAGARLTIFTNRARRMTTLTYLNSLKRQVDSTVRQLAQQTLNFTNQTDYLDNSFGFCGLIGHLVVIKHVGFSDHAVASADMKRYS